MGNKLAACEATQAVGVPVMSATGPLPKDAQRARKIAEAIGYPLMLQASWGGGGTDMRTIESCADLDAQIAAARHEGKAAFENDEVYLEELVPSARHFDVQVIGELNGNLVYLCERDSSVRRRNQKVVERAPAHHLADRARTELYDAMLRLMRSVGYTHAGTAEFLRR